MKLQSALPVTESLRRIGIQKGDLLATVKCMYFFLPRGVRMCFVFVFFFSMMGMAQSPQVPHKMQFANLTLNIRDDARREIQKDVDALTQSPRHFNIKVERARTYFPVIEKIFAEENLPEDFKYLVLQESALIPDAVSVSNAVGFWQFKDFTAIEMGLRVDREIDERMNIAASTRAAARYLKKNNHFFNNWLYALQAYQMGAGGVMKAVKDTEGGARHMEINSATYWYVKKYLAHKIAFENAVGGKGQLELFLLDNNRKKSLSDLAKEVTVDEEELKAFNKWAKAGVIPDDKVYSVAIPVRGNMAMLNMPVVQASTSQAQGKISTDGKEERIKVNGITALMARQGEDAASLAKRAGIDVEFLLKCNDLSANDKLVAGQHYFISRKRARSTKAYHTVGQGENLWKISQQYAVRLKKLKRYNRISSGADVREGMTLWLSATRPKDSDKPAATEEIAQVVELDNEATFNWQVTPAVNHAPVAVSVPSGNEAINTETGSDTTSAVPVQPPVVIKQDMEQVTVPAEHVIEAGETLYGISKKYGLEVMDLIARNNLNLQDGIKPGQVLKLREDSADNERETRVTEEKAEVHGTEVIHEVRPTDTLYGIARRYGVTISDLMDLNNKTDFNLTVGEKLKVRQK